MHNVLEEHNRTATITPNPSLACEHKLNTRDTISSGVFGFFEAYELDSSST